MYLVYRSYHLYLGRLEDEKTRVEIEAAQVEAEKRHVEEVCALHLRTIEGLILAIEAKDHNTHAHLRRVGTYAVELGKELNLGAASSMLCEPRRCCTISANWPCRITSSTSLAV